MRSRRATWLCMREVAQHYFYTPAGYEAALLVAQQEADSGRHLSAGLVVSAIARHARSCGNG